MNPQRPIQQFHWQNRKTGKTGITMFDESHVRELNGRFGTYFNWLDDDGITIFAALLLINKWNNDDWYYWAEL